MSMVMVIFVLPRARLSPERDRTHASGCKKSVYIIPYFAFLSILGFPGLSAPASDLFFPGAPPPHSETFFP